MKMRIDIIILLKSRKTFVVKFSAKPCVFSLYKFPKRQSLDEDREISYKPIPASFEGAPGNLCDSLCGNWATHSLPAKYVWGNRFFPGEQISLLIPFGLLKKDFFIKNGNLLAN